MIAKCPKTPKDNKKRRKQVHFNEKGYRACDNSKNYNDHKIYAYVARMSSDDECKSVKYDDSSQLTNLILRFGRNVPYDARSFVFNSGVIRRYG